MCGTCLGALLRDVEYSVGVMPIGNDWQFDGYGGFFVT